MAPALAPTLFITTATQMLATSSVLALATIPTLVAGKLGIAPHLIGYQVSLIYSAGILASAHASGLVKRYGSARIGQTALFLAAAGLAGLATGLLQVMLLASVLIGVGYALINPSSSHILKRVTPPPRRNLVYSIKQAGVPVGGILAALIVPPLSSWTDWRLALLVFAAGAFALGVVYFPLRTSWDIDADPKAKVVGGVWKGQRALWSQPGLGPLALIGLFYSAIQLCVSAFLVVMLIDDFGWTPIHAGAMAAAVQAFGAFGRIFWGVVADAARSGFLVLAFLGVVTMCCCLFLSVATRFPPATTLVALCVLGACSVGWNGVMLAETARLSPGRTGTLTGETQTYTFIGVMFGPSSYAVCFAWTQSYTLTFALFSAPAVFGAAAALYGMRATRPAL